jgi:hypothetical protein
MSVFQMAAEGRDDGRGACLGGSGRLTRGWSKPPTTMHGSRHGRDGNPPTVPEATAMVAPLGGSARSPQQFTQILLVQNPSAPSKSLFDGQARQCVSSDHRSNCGSCSFSDAHHPCKTCNRNRRETRTLRHLRTQPRLSLACGPQSLAFCSRCSSVRSVSTNIVLPVSDALPRRSFTRSALSFCAAASACCVAESRSVTAARYQA